MCLCVCVCVCFTECVKDYLQQAKAHMRETCQVKLLKWILLTPCVVILLSYLRLIDRSKDSWRLSFKTLLSGQQEMEAGLRLDSHYVDVQLVPKQILSNGSKSLDKDLVVMRDVEQNLGWQGSSQVRKLQTINQMNSNFICMDINNFGQRINKLHIYSSMLVYKVCIIFICRCSRTLRNPKPSVILCC